MPKKFITKNIQENICYRYKDNIISTLKVDLHELWLINHACKITNIEIKNLEKCFNEALNILSAIIQKRENDKQIKENKDVIKMLKEENRKMRETLGLKG